MDKTGPLRQQIHHGEADYNVQGGSLLTGALGGSSGSQVGVILEKGSWCSRSAGRVTVWWRRVRIRSFKVDSAL